MQKTLRGQLKTLGFHVSRIQYAIDAGRARAAARFARTFARWMRENNFSDSKIWNNYSGLDAFAFPGGYPLFYLDSTGATLCPACAVRALADSDASRRPADADVNYENDALTCDDCSTRIESAYGTPDADETTAAHAVAD